MTFTQLTTAMAALHAPPRSRFYSSILVLPSQRAWRNTNARGETEIIGHPSYWRKLRDHPDVREAESCLPDPFGIPVIDLDTDPGLRRRVLEPIFSSALEAA